MACSATSCGWGSMAIFQSGSGNGGNGNAPTVASDLTIGDSPADLKSSPVLVSFRLTDAESDPVDVAVVYESPSGGLQVPMLLVGNPSLTELASSPGGTVHTFTWDYAAQLTTGSSYVEGLGAAVTLVEGSGQARSPPFAVG